MKLNVSKLQDIITQLREELSDVKRANSQLREELNRFKAIQANSEQSLDIIQETQQQKLPEVEQSSTVNEGIFEIDCPVAVTTANNSVPVTNSNFSRSTSQLEQLPDESVQQYADANNAESVVKQSEVIRIIAPSAQEQDLKVATKRRLSLRNIAKQTKLCSQVSVNLDNINDFRATKISLRRKNIRANGNGFTKKTHTMKHIRVHNGKRYACDVKNCNSVYKTINGLTHHKLTHAGLKPFSCNECNRSFGKKSNLSTHMLIHTGEKPHLCEVCNRSFSQKSHLSAHMLIHTGEKPYFCEVCETSFRTKRTLSDHLNIHTGEKRHSCKVCNKSFRQKTTLQLHSRIHTGEKPLVCTVCNASFRQKSNLTIHSKKCVGKNQVNEQLPFCGYCGKGFSMKTNLRSHCLNCYKNHVGTLRRSSN